MMGVQPSGSHWNHTEIGAGRIVPGDATLRLTTEDATAGRYSNAQLDDYGGLPRSGFPWQPPVTLTVRARFSHSTVGNPRHSRFRLLERFLHGGSPARSATRRLVLLCIAAIGHAPRRADSGLRLEGRDHRRLAPVRAVAAGRRAAGRTTDESAGWVRPPVAVLPADLSHSRAGDRQRHRHLAYLYPGMARAASALPRGRTARTGCTYCACGAAWPGVYGSIINTWWRSPGAGCAMACWTCRGANTLRSLPLRSRRLA